MEAEFYLRATTGKGTDNADSGSDAGRVGGGHQAQFQHNAIREFVEELAEMNSPMCGSIARHSAGAL
jgi:hypothetical protein